MRREGGDSDGQDKRLTWQDKRFPQAEAARLLGLASTRFGGRWGATRPMACAG
ncbi:hypothetical protein IHE30_00455 [Mycetohabitans sp. B46]